MSWRGEYQEEGRNESKIEVNYQGGGNKEVGGVILH